MDEQDRQNTQFWSNLQVGHFRSVKPVIVSRIRSGVFDAPSLASLRLQFSGLLALYRESNAERNRGSLSGLPGFILAQDVQPLTRAQTVLLWDSLAFYLWGSGQQDVVDTIIAIFVANKVLEHVRIVLADDGEISEDEEATLRRVTKARVVLPLRLDRPETEAQSIRLNASQVRMMLDAHDQLVARGRLREMERARDDIEETLVLISAERASTERREDEARTGRLRATLASRVAPDVLESVLADVSAATDRTAQPSLLSMATTRLANPIATRLLTQAHRPTDGPEAMLARIDSNIYLLADTVEPIIATVHTSTLLAYGAEFTIEERIPPGAIALKMHRAPEGGMDVFLTYHHGAERPPLGHVGGTLSIGSAPQQIVGEPQHEEEDAFQTFRLTREPVETSFFDISLTLMTLAVGAEPASLDPIRLFTSIPHVSIPDLTLDLGEDVDPPPIIHGVARLGLIEYRRVEQELTCYVTGAISRIENILASEFKERVSRSLSLVESEQEITQETASEFQTDTETSESFAMQAETANVLREETEKSFEAGVSVSAGFGNSFEMTADTGFHYNTISSKEHSTTEAIELAKSVTQKVQQRIMQKATSRRRSLSRKEFEDINKHGFDNRQNPDHVVAVHRHVDEVHTHRLVNLGEREVIEITIPEPANAFIFAQSQKQQEEEEDLKVRRPRRPRRVGLRGPQSLNEDTWRKFGRIYGVDLSPPPARFIRVSRAFAETANTGALASDEEVEDLPAFPPVRAAAYNEIDVPAGYLADRAWVHGGGLGSTPDGGLARAGITVGHIRFEHDDEPIDLPDIANIVPVLITSQLEGAYSTAVTVRCRRSAQIYRQWQMSSYTALIEAYRAKKDAYDDAREDHEEAQAELDLNPRFKRQHMEREIKRLCIEMLTNRFDINVSANHYEQDDEDCFPKVRQHPALDRHAEIVKFFEQAFDWAIMSYIFYPYFYGPKRSWSVKLSLEATRNRLFSSFLTSGMARVMLPVRIGMEEAVNLFMDTGEIWFGGGLVLDSHNDLYLSIADELSTGIGREQEIEAEWEVKLPTHHTIVQSAASALIEDGLPCRDEEMRIGRGNSTLAPLLDDNQSPSG
ncbi:MAG: hypothetical protein RDA78_08650 [Roseibium sp.]|uniref:hypothetical protein n=1 Tax=Roseibium sp. TaxID=1936156 RepID=UPI003D9C56A1